MVGQLTTPVGLFDAGRGAFIEDGGAGVALRLLSGDWAPFAVGDSLLVSGVLVSDSGQLTIELDDPSAVSWLNSGSLPAPLMAATGLLCEPFEGRAVSVSGLIVDDPVVQDDGFSTLIDDGSGALEVVVPAASGVVPEDLPRAGQFTLGGVVGQFDPTGAGTGYRLIVRFPQDVMPPMPTPTPSPSPSPTATSTATASDGPLLSIAEARALPLGSTATVTGTVTVAAGWILGDTTFAIEDDSAGIYVRLLALPPDGVTPGRQVEVTGELAAPYGNLELRPAGDGVAVLGMVNEVVPRPLTMADLGEQTEGLLARVSGTIDSVAGGSSGSVTVILADASGEGRIFLHDTLGATTSDFHTGETLSVTGLVGDRLGLYRVWPRQPLDIVHSAGPTPTPGLTQTPTSSSTPTPSPRPTATTSAAPSGPTVAIAEALHKQGQRVTVEGTVSVRGGLLDTNDQRVTIQDATAAVLVRLPDNEATAVGDLVRVTGVVGTYYGAPQLAADQLVGVSRSALTAFAVSGAPISADLEWRLVTVTGEITAVSRDGDAWRAELAVDGGSIPITSLTRSAIPATAVEEGHKATITGIVKRAYPTASDQRFSVVPRATTDIVLDGAMASPGGSVAPTGGMGASLPPGSLDMGGPAAPTSAAGASGGGLPLAVALVDLPGHLGQLVAVGGRVAALSGTLVAISDESGTAQLRLDGPAADIAAVLSPGDLVNAVGTVIRDEDGAIAVAVEDAQAITRLVPLAGGPTQPSPTDGTPRPLSSASVDASEPLATAAPAAALVALILLTAATALLVAVAHPRTRVALFVRLSGVRERARAALAVRSKHEPS